MYLDQPFTSRTFIIASLLNISNPPKKYFAIIKYITKYLYMSSKT
nr:MAG TPA: hypothetical protein [Caudoviricetes sp.]